MNAPTLPTVREVGRLALPLGSQLVAGALGLERPVRWARASGVVSPLFPTLNADEVALLDLPTVQASNPSLSLARIVRELGRLRIAAIAVRGEVDAAARREAERGNLPLFALPNESDVARAMRAIIRLLSDREAQEEAQAAALYRHLSQEVAAGRGLSGLVTELHQLSGHAVRVVAPQGETLAQAGSAPADAVEWTHPVRGEEAPAAQLALRDASEALDRFARMALEQGAAALALEWVKLEAVEAAREGAHGDLVAALLAGESDALLLARARVAAYPLDAVQWVVVAIAGGREETEERLGVWARRAAAHAETLGWQPRFHLSQGAMPPIGPFWQATLLLAGGSAGWEGQRATYLAHLAEMAPGAEPLTLAAGNPAPALAGLRQAVAQASDALALGLRLFGPGRRFLHHEMGLYRLLRHLQGTEDLQEFLDGTLAALEAYDAEHGSALVETLRELLAQGGNVSATAKAMHLHRNSLLYRLERIREVAALDPADPDDAFALRLALMLAPLR